MLEIGVEEDAAHEDDLGSVADEERLAKIYGLPITQVGSLESEILLLLDVDYLLKFTLQRTLVRNCQNNHSFLFLNENGWNTE